MFMTTKEKALLGALALSFISSLAANLIVNYINKKALQKASQ